MPYPVLAQKLEMSDSMDIIAIFTFPGIVDFRTDVIFILRERPIMELHQLDTLRSSVAYWYPIRIYEIAFFRMSPSAISCYLIVFNGTRRFDTRSGTPMRQRHFYSVATRLTYQDDL